ncbi:hypothetical protein [Hymenobacter negativus]|uniref:Uncharacterized protein n=1 Tax=Hymenobacter negativus TaxID=2795026 RepID=A0ABS3QJ18_9BACT|nr:hypothetical protein [Hymenobacter negativus]MBO2010705.1 hypothetical protein [Hymenobacter negativus]
MPAAPRMRQLRRDKTVFALVMNIIRIYLEEDSLLAQQPHLRETPNADLLHLQQVADRWLGLTTAYVIRKHRCSMSAAIQTVAELQTELKASIPEAEMRAIPLSVVLSLPPGLMP